MSNNNITAFAKSDRDGYNPGAMRSEERSQQLEEQAEAEQYKKKNGGMQWQTNGKQYFSCGGTTDKLESGVYTLFFQPNQEPAFAKTDLLTDGLLKFDDSISAQIVKDIDYFWSKEAEAKFKKYDFLHRRGFMFYGPPGSGKTCLVHQIIENVLEKGGVAFLCDCNPALVEKSLSAFRAIEPTRQVVCLFEDIDAILTNYGESQLLSLLDGENNVKHVLNIATTNYPQRLDRRIVARPRRFDRIIRIGMPTDAMRLVYFTKKMGIEDATEIKQLVDATKGFSFAACADLVISVKCLNKTIAESVEVLKVLSNKENLVTDEEDEQIKDTLRTKKAAINVVLNAANTAPVTAPAPKKQPVKLNGTVKRKVSKKAKK